LIIVFVPDIKEVVVFLKVYCLHLLVIIISANETIILSKKHCLNSSANPTE